MEFKSFLLIEGLIYNREDDINHIFELNNKEFDNVVDTICEMAINDPQAKAASAFKKTLDVMGQRAKGFADQCKRGNQNACKAHTQLADRISKAREKLTRNKLV